MEAAITVTGNVGTDISLYGGGEHDWCYAQFRIASTRRVNRGGVWQDGETTWLSVLCRNRTLAQNVKASLAKGDPVIVQGRLTTSTWNDSVEGKQERHVIEALSVGHDLVRGCSTFRRNEKPVVEPTGRDQEFEEPEDGFAERPRLEAVSRG